MLDYFCDIDSYIKKIRNIKNSPQLLSQKACETYYDTTYETKYDKKCHTTYKVRRHSINRVAISCFD